MELDALRAEVKDIVTIISGLSVKIGVIEDSLEQQKEEIQLLFSKMNAK